MSNLNSLGSLFATIQKKQPNPAPIADSVQSKTSDFSFVTENADSKIIMDFTSPDSEENYSPPPKPIVVELSSRVMDNYVKKAEDSESKIGMRADHAAARGDYNKASKLAVKEKNRRVGINLANKKLTTKTENETPEKRRARIIENALNKTTTFGKITELSDAKIDAYKTKVAQKGLPSSDNELIKRYKGAGLAAKRIKTVKNEPKSPAKTHEEFDPMKNLVQFLDKSKMK